MSKLRWGILGTGMIASKFAGDLPHSERGELSVVGSRTLESANKFTSQFGGTAVEGYDAVIDSPDIDALYLALPNHLHAPIAIQALKAGKHVLCEKPVSLSVAEAEEMFSVAKDSGKHLVEAFMYRCRPIIQKLIEKVHSGAIGDLQIIRSNFTFEREPNLKDARYQPDNGGGSLMDVGCYCVHLSRTLAKAEPTEVHAVAHRHDTGVDDYAAGVLKFQSGPLVTFTSGMTVTSDKHTHIAGSKGRIEIDMPWLFADSFTIIQDDEKTTVCEESSKPIYAHEADAFAATVLDGAPPVITPEDSLANMKVIEQLKESTGIFQ